MGNQKRINDEAVASSISVEWNSTEFLEISVLKFFKNPIVMPRDTPMLLL